MTDDIDNMRFWSISIKRVNESEPDSFTVQVSPEDDVAWLQREIRSVTGIEPDRQRLIYRGRLISCSSSPNSESGRVDITDNEKVDPEMTRGSIKLRDIAGLDNGHTIHLFSRKEPIDDLSSIETSDADIAATNETSTTGTFLTALLGVDEDAETRRSSPVAVSPVSAMSPLRTPRLRASPRRFNHRLEAGDVAVSDPGSMESVRQGLLTLHTLLPAMNMPSPLHVNRQWYKGQWIDCLDTVNQWLEATIIDLAEPDAILPPRADGCITSTSVPSRSHFITSEPRYQDSFIAANELERRVYLCLEPCAEGCVEDEGGEYSGWKRRDNRGIKLILVHYNGWPHRWDEWIRSDSDRIRPFRTRTRHPSSSSFASPAPQCIYAESPPTHIRSHVESEDREALLPELGRVMGQINSILHRINSRAPLPVDTRTDVNPSTLPWRIHYVRHGANRTHEEDKEGCENREFDDEVGHEVEYHGLNDQAGKSQELQVLASLLDRLGRTLIDAAPHVASLAQAAPAIGENSSAGPILEPEGDSSTGRSLGGLLSLLSRERRHRSARSDNNLASTDEDNLTLEAEESLTGDANESVSIDPDLRDFSASMVNTTRGEIRGGPRNRGQPNSNDPAGLLNFLASASLSQGGHHNDGGLHRILRDRNGNIDITIHAIVTGPGIPSGVLGLSGLVGTGERQMAMVGSNNDTAALSELGAGDTLVPIDHGSNHANPAYSLRRHPPILDDEDGIFSDLYSETPQPAYLGVAGDTSSTDDAFTSIGDIALTSHPISPRRIQSFSTTRVAGSTTAYATSGRNAPRRLFSRFFRRSNSQSGS